MAIDADKFKGSLSEGFIKLLDSKRGVSTQLADAIGKPTSFISEIKRGKPVNSLHLKAVGIVFGKEKVLELMALDNNEYESTDNNVYIDKNSIKNDIDILHSEIVTLFQQKELAQELNWIMIQLERINPENLIEIKGYIKRMLSESRTKQEGDLLIKAEQNGRKVERTVEKEKNGQ